MRYYKFYIYNNQSGTVDSKLPLYIYRGIFFIYKIKKGGRVYGFDYETCTVKSAIDEQYSDIALGVDKGIEVREEKMMNFNLVKTRW